MYCAKCGQKLKDNTKFCPKCGTLVKSAANGETLDFDRTPGFNLKQMKCPSCGALIPYGESIDHVRCNYCGAEYVIDDSATATDRILRAYSNAKMRDTQTQIEYEEIQHKREDELQEAKLKLERQRQDAAKEIAREKTKTAKAKNEDNSTKWLVILMIVFCVMLFLMPHFFPDSTVDHSNDVQAPISAKECVGENYETIEKQFEDAGFTNISSEALGDLVTGVLKKAGSVDKVTINGDSAFINGYYPKKAAVRIFYHSFKDKKTKTKK